MTTVLILLMAPVVAGLVSLGLRSSRALHLVNLSTIITIGSAQSLLTLRLFAEGPFLLFNGWIAFDALSAFILIIVTGIGLTSSFYSWSYFDRHLQKGDITPIRLSRYFFLFHLFMFTMILAILANNLGILWVAIEGTTLATTFMINFYRRNTSLEAGWKYFILCSMGIALALFGTVLMFLSSVRTAGDVGAALNVSSLIQMWRQLDPHIVRLSFLFILIGYGTKVGLFPMHTWMPEAYSEAPAPVSAMLAGVLETVVFYAILRFKTIVDAVLPDGYAGHLLMAFGLVSFLVAAAFILFQKDFKRLFAYSSVEHMGIAAMGFGAGGVIGTFGALFHLFNHAIAKSLGFFASGNIQLQFGTRNIDQVSGLIRNRPVTATALLISGLALVGMPPFSLFVSEFMILSALAKKAYQSGTLHFGQFFSVTLSDDLRNLILVTAFLLVSVTVFGGFMYRILKMLQGRREESGTSVREWGADVFPILLSVAGVVLSGLFIPRSLKTLMDQAVNILTELSRG